MVSWWRLVVAAGLLVFGLSLAIWGFMFWTRLDRTPDGAICASVWHFRPGHGELHGGLQTPGQLENGTDACRLSARTPFVHGKILVILAGMSGVTGLAIAASGLPRRDPSRTV